MKRVICTVCIWLAMVVGVLALSGCATPAPLPERVLVPVPVPCKVAIPAPFEPPVALLNEGAPDAEKARALAMYIEQLHGRSQALEALLRGCQTSHTK